MALDATPAGASADSYLTVAAADALAGADLGPEPALWLNAATTTAIKEAALKRATREIDAYLRSGWTRHSPTQALRFPRSIDVNTSGSPIIPVDLQRATYQQAIYLNKNATILAAANRRRARNVSNASEPDVSYTQGDPEEPLASMSALAIHYLSGYATAPKAQRAGSVRSARVSSGFVGGR
jgi:hypothetical protein